MPPPALWPSIWKWVRETHAGSGSMTLCTAEDQLLWSTLVLTMSFHVLVSVMRNLVLTRGMRFSVLCRAQRAPVSSMGSGRFKYMFCHAFLLGTHPVGELICPIALPVPTGSLFLTEEYWWYV
eukprot:3940037-Rhodomonas_salina.1